VDNIRKDNRVLILLIYPRLIYKIIVKRFGKIRKPRIPLMMADLRVPCSLEHLILLYSQSLYHIEIPFLVRPDNIILRS
jgi:hypothetical protein